MKHIVVTGAAGFIGSYLVGALNEEGYTDIIIVDDFSRNEKLQNWENKQYSQRVDRKFFDAWLLDNHDKVEFIFHLGARTDTTDTNRFLFHCMNFEYTKKVWLKCEKYKIPLVYASSAATYGDGAVGYSDDHELISKLRPLNPYAVSKNNFDKWALEEPKKPPMWWGFKFFNVYGPNEYHKGRMASVAFHAYHQMQEDKKIKLFQSHRSDFDDGMQKRDFVYVKDVAKVLIWTMKNKPESGIYNLGTGKAETFLTLAQTLFSSANIAEDIEFIPIPEDIREKYQYFTEADITKLREAGYQHPFYTLSEGVKEYTTMFLSGNKIF